MKKQPNISLPSSKKGRANLRKEQSRGEEGNIDNVQFPLSGFIGNSSSGQDISSYTK